MALLEIEKGKRLIIALTVGTTACLVQRNLTQLIH